MSDNRKQALRAEVVDGRLLVSIGVDALAEAARLTPELEAFDEQLRIFIFPTIPSHLGLAQDVAKALMADQPRHHEGLSLAESMIGQAIVNAVEFGSENIVWDDQVLA